MTDEDATDAAWGTTSFVPGGHVGLVSRHTVGIIARDNPSTRQRLWELAAVDAPLDDILDDLSSTGLKALPDFGLAQAEPGGIRVVARGAVVITATRTTGDDRVIDPSGVRTWVEEVIDDVTAIEISLVGTEDADVAEPSDTFAVLAGSVPAVSLTRRFDTADELAEEALASGWSARADSPEQPAESPTDDGPEPAPIPEVDVRMPDDVDEPDHLDTDDSPEIAPSAEWFDEGAGDEAISASIPPQPSVEPTPESADRPAPDAAPSAVQPAPPVVPAGPPAGPGTGGPPPSSAISPRPVPTDTPPPSAAASVPSGPPPPGAVPGPPPPGATVDESDAIASPSSLFDDAAGDTTAVDTTAIAPSGSQRATHAMLLFSNGERVAVDRPVIIGRNPKVSGGVDGVLPHIMKFDGPGQGLSRTHAEVRVDDGVLVVEDLNSTNGTEVEVPGHPRTCLIGGEPLAIGPGVLIDFGDELHCTVESAN